MTNFCRTKEKASLSTVDSDLTDELIKTLSIKFFTFGTDTGFPSFSSLKFVLKSGSELDDFGLGGRSTFDGLDPKFLLLHGVLSWRKDGVQNILGLGLCHVFFVLLAKSLSRFAFLGSGDLGKLG